MSNKTNVQVMPTSFLVRANDKNSCHAMMIVSNSVKMTSDGSTKMLKNRSSGDTPSGSDASSSR